MSRRFTGALLAGAVLIPTVLMGQAPAPPPATAPGGNRFFPVPLAEPGKPIESRPPERAINAPAFSQQTRAPYHKSVDYDVQVITDKLKNPWAITFLPSGNFLITERENPAAMRIVTPAGVISEPLKGLEHLAISGRLGVLEVALDRQFASNKRVFFTFFERLPKGYSNTFVGRATLDEAGLALNNVEVIFRAQPVDGIDNLSTKQGGRIAVAKDGNMFITIGDRDSGVPWLKAQELNNHMGKILRLDPNGAAPKDNPFVGKAGAMPEIWAYGQRSQQGLTIDPKTGHLWETEHGPRGGDELNQIKKGGNYGWPIIVYGIDYPGRPIGDNIDKKAGMEQPTYYWDPVIAPSGLTFYRGNKYPQWKDSMFVGALRGMMITRLKMKNDKVVEEEAMLVELKSRIRDVRVGPDGALYVLTEQNRLLRVTPKR